MILSCDPLSAFYPPDGRWKRATHLASTGRKRVHHVDQWDRLALQLARSMLGHAPAKSTKRNTLALAQHAFAVYRVNSLLKGELEGRLLAGESLPAIAAKVHLAPEVVEAYHEIFFCVQRNLDATDYILTNVLTLRIHEPLESLDVVTVLRYFGYVAGSKAIDALLPCYRTSGRFPEDTTNLPPEIQSVLTSRQRIRCVALARSLPCSAEHLPALLQLSAILEEPRKPLTTVPVVAQWPTPTNAVEPTTVRPADRDMPDHRIVHPFVKSA